MSFKAKKIVCVLLISFLVVLEMIPTDFFQRKQLQPQGEYITGEEAVTLVELLKVFVEDFCKENMTDKEVQLIKEEMEILKEIVSSWDTKDFITYKQFQQWSQVIGNMVNVSKDFALSEIYKPSFYITKKDWYSYFEKLCVVIDPERNIKTEELLILGDHSNVVDIAGNPIEEGWVYTQNGRWEKKIGDAGIKIQQKASYITYKGALWGVYDVQENAELSNVWIVESTEDNLMYFYKNYKIVTGMDNRNIREREQVADLYFGSGQLQEARIKTQKVTGKVLKVSEKEIELEGQGCYALSENIQYYRLYGRLENVGRSEIPIGYSFTDFIIEDGKIQSALLVKDEKMETIRVLIKNSNFDGYFHDKVEGKANVDLELLCGDKKIQIPAGEPFVISKDSEYFVGNRIYIRPKALTGRCVFTNIERNNHGQGYLGDFELEKREEGILLVNEVLLEEYLYAVVPSEMPGNYPLEALKAQAICARTYAYDKMRYPNLASYGANLDDSATYQVYNNIKENTNTTTAVKETRGELLYTEQGLAKTYYYSTSCGYGTDAGIWNTLNTDTMPYLKAKEMSVSQSSYEAKEMKKEEIFADFITQNKEAHFESRENWYRWKYEHTNIAVIAEKLRQRIEDYPKYIFTSKDGDNWGNKPMEEEFVITDIRVKKRASGGTIEELLVTTDKGYFLVKNEYHVRAVLADGQTKVILQNEGEYACANLLPSAFFTIELLQDGEKLTGIKLTGGGFGHGVGMSQNGAKNLALLGFDAKKILEFYYEGCQVGK